MTTSEQIADLAAALVKAQAMMAPALKESMNPAFRAKYADLTSVWAACRVPLTSNGLAVVQDVAINDVGVAVTTRLVHTSGQWMEFGPLVVPVNKRDAQGVGSATSYGRRYTLSAAVGVVSDDDDAEGTKHGAEMPQERRPLPPKPAPRPVPQVAATGQPAPPVEESELPPPAERSVKAGHGADLLISDAQAKRFHAIATTAGWKTPELKAWLFEVWNLDSSRKIPRAQYDAICEAVEHGYNPNEPPF